MSRKTQENQKSIYQMEKNDCGYHKVAWHVRPSVGFFPPLNKISQPYLGILFVSEIYISKVSWEFSYTWIPDDSNCPAMGTSFPTHLTQISRGFYAPWL